MSPGFFYQNLEAGSDGRVAAVKLGDESTIEADTIIIGIGAKPAVNPFELVGLNTTVGGIQVDDLFRTSIPGIFVVGDVAAFPLKIYDRVIMLVDQHSIALRRYLVHGLTHMIICPILTQGFLSMKGAPGKFGGSFLGTMLERVEIGNFDPKSATFWIDSGKLKGVFLKSGSAGEFKLLPELARIQPSIDKAQLQKASSVEEALEMAKASLLVE